MSSPPPHSRISPAVEEYAMAQPTENLSPEPTSDLREFWEARIAERVTAGMSRREAIRDLIRIVEMLMRCEGVDVEQLRA